ncbi:CheR family methyltransferase [Maridesulfovibrio frigidus]|uniref:CheR family methyltransferase n=1 Tax=Maridesulfovibrio frigidus TaxID=340956 RepID=UPI00068B9A12|nr:protein-glutamate O-methyltransferase CheR [Maridesulfovibrio frigidus]
MNISNTEFNLLRKHIYGLCGLIIGEGKEYLIVHRLKHLLIEKGCKSWTEFYNALRSGNESLREEVISAISTHETSFFRDNHPFNAIRKTVIPLLVKNKKPNRKIRIWCAASSTGQEPYTLSMIIHDLVNSCECKNTSLEDFDIIATDISKHVIEQARKGEFSELEISRGLPAQYGKYFKEKGSLWKVSESVKSLVTFQKLNLLDSFGALGKFDFVLCRNVLIYFDEKTKFKIVHRIHELLPDKGHLLLGATETLAGQTDRFVSVREGLVILYRKKNNFRAKDKIRKPIKIKNESGRSKRSGVVSGRVALLGGSIS